MPELFIELISEDIPSAMQDYASKSLADATGQWLAECHLAYGNIFSFATPRRLVVVAEQVAGTQTDRVAERRGPRVDAPEKARAGFLRGLGHVDYDLTEIEDKKGRFWLAKFVEKGQPTTELLARSMPEILKHFPWPKSMRWGTGDLRWVRPLQSVNCVFGGKQVEFEIDGLRSGNTSCGHRFLAPAPFSVHDFSDYQDRLSKSFVILDGSQRLEIITTASSELARQQDLRLRDDPGLLDEIKGLVEWPVPLLGRIDDGFMDLPSEVLVTSMREHQKYLALEREDGQLAPFFIVVANLAARDGGQSIIKGNERVLRARLWDAKFFWQQDRKRSLDSRNVDLEAMVFHERLGNLRQKAFRLENLAAKISGEIANGNQDAAGYAGRLAKCDLVTGMVGEFPELQGIMGGHYARAEGLPSEITDAISEQYQFGGSDISLSGPVSCAVNLADKLDTLVGFFGAGIRPTGSKDPFALRRMAAGIAWIIRRHGLRISLRRCIALALDQYHSCGIESVNSTSELIEEVLSFIKLRGSTSEIAAERDARPKAPFNIPSVFNTVFARPDDDLVRLDHLRIALLDLLDSDDGQSLTAAFRRANNILKIESKKEGVQGFGSAVDPGLMIDPFESELLEKLNHMADPLEQSMRNDDFASAMSLLASSRAAIDNFFENVMVNTEEPNLRLNRLRLLTVFCEQTAKIADLSLIED